MALAEHPKGSSPTRIDFLSSISLVDFRFSISASMARRAPCAPGKAAAPVDAQRQTDNSSGLRFVLSHPFAQNAKGWGTEMKGQPQILRLVRPLRRANFAQDDRVGMGSW